MRTRSHWLTGAFMAAALAVVLIGSAAASQFFLGLSTTDTEWQLGGEANLDVSVDAALVGGYGKLYRTIAGDTVFIETFAFTSTDFAITAPIPSDPAHAGQQCEFRYAAFMAGGTCVGGSPIARKPIPPIDIE